MGRETSVQTDSETEYDSEDEREILRAGAAGLGADEVGEEEEQEVNQEEDGEKEKSKNE